MRKKIQIGQRFGKLTVIKEEGCYFNRSGIKDYIWIVKCKCGNEFSIFRNSLYNAKHCKKCAVKHLIIKDTTNSTIWKNIITHAKLKNLTMSKEITRKYLYNLYIKQNKKCALSGRDIYLAASRKDKKENTASLDRIDSSKGYLINNIQWVDKRINIMKWAYPQDHFIKLCEKVATNNK